MRNGQTLFRHMTIGEAMLAQRHARVLVAEDDREMRALLARTLGRAGFELEVAASGDEALECIANHLLHEPPQPFDLIVADIRMPGFTGLDLLASVRYRDWSVPVILITAFGTPELHAEARRLGAFAVFDKPFDLDDLRTAVLNATPLHCG